MKKILLYVLAFMLVISFASKFDFIAEPISKAIGQPLEVVKDWGNIIFYVALGSFLIWAGAVSMAVPIIGGALILVGVGLIGMALYTKFKKPASGNANDL